MTKRVLDYHYPSYQPIQLRHRFLRPLTNYTAVFAVILLMAALWILDTARHGGFLGDGSTPFFALAIICALGVKLFIPSPVLAALVSAPIAPVALYLVYQTTKDGQRDAFAILLIIFGLPISLLVSIGVGLLVGLGEWIIRKAQHGRNHNSVK